jgi:hypothetical protein
VVPALDEHAQVVDRHSCRPSRCGQWSRPAGAGKPRAQIDDGSAGTSMVKGVNSEAAMATTFYHEVAMAHPRSK